MDFCFFGSDQSASHHFPDHRMVLGNLFYARRVKPIGPTISDVGNPDKTLGVEEHRHDGGPHAAKFGVLERSLVHPRIGGADRVVQHVG